MSEHNSIKGYSFNKASHEKWIRLLVNNWDQYMSNYRLMKLRVVPFNIVQRSKKDSYKEVCDYYELTQFKDFIESLHNIN